MYADIYKCLERYESLPNLNSSLKNGYLRQLRRRIAMADFFHLDLEPEIESYRE